MGRPFHAQIVKDAAGLQALDTATHAISTFKNLTTYNIGSTRFVSLEGRVGKKDSLCMCIIPHNDDVLGCTLLAKWLGSF
jgi:hypothetical protein